MSTALPDIPGVVLEGEIGRGRTSVVYRARRGRETYAVKIQRDTGGAASDRSAAQRFRREAALAASLSHPALPQIVAVGEAAGRAWLIREYVAGRPLSAVIAEGAQPQERVVAIAEALAGALAEVHRHGLVHRDVKPANILVDERGGARLIDFGFATRTARGAGEDTELAEDSDEVVGTLLYAAPEQSGMIKRLVDGRADLYALGVVLFEAATGRPPFVSSDVAELVRQHAVADPPRLTELRRGLSPALSAIVHRLLAKDPDDRYQTADGLRADLQRLSALDEGVRGLSPEQQQERIARQLGRQDRANEGRPGPRVVGREGELLRLRSRWKEVLGGLGTFVMIEGESGMGKSRLAREFLREARTSRALVLEAACHPDDSAPFSALARAFELAVERIERLPAERRTRDRERLREAAGELGPLISRLSPRLAAALGPVTAPADRGLLHEQFQAGLVSFLVRLAEVHTAAVLVLDGVQWLDRSTLEVLGHLSRRIRETRLLVLATVRSGADAEGVARFTSAAGGAISTRLVLAPLTQDALGHLIAEQLGGQRVDPELVSFVHHWSGGSPLAASEYVRALLDAGLLRPWWGTWVLEEDGAERVALPGDVRELLVGRLAELSDGTRQVLTSAALLGARFSADPLPEICGLEDAEVHAAMLEAARAHLIEPLEGGRAAFVHDEVREALLAGLDDVERRDLHQRIAEVLDGRDDVDIFELARHYGAGAPDSDPERVYEVSAAAGRAAVEGYASELAVRFYRQAREARERARMPIDADLEGALGDVCARTGRFDEAVGNLGRALEELTDPVDRARMRARLAEVHLWGRFDTRRSLRHVRDGLRELGSPLRDGVVAATLATVWRWIAGRVMQWTHLGFGRATGAARERLRVMERLHVVGGLCSYFDARPGLMLQMVGRSLVAAHRLGASPQLVECYCNHAVLYGVLGRRRAAGRYAARAVDLATELGDRRLLARATLFRALSRHFLGRSVEAGDLVRRFLDEQERWVDVWDYLSASGDLAWNMLMRGYFRDAWSVLERAFARARIGVEADGGGMIQRYPSIHWAGSILTVLGRAQDGSRFLARGEAAGEERSRYHTAAWLAQKLLVKLDLGQTDEPEVEELIARHHEVGIRLRLCPFYLRDFYVIQAYVRLAQANAAVAGRGAERHGLEEAVGRLAVAARELKTVATRDVLRAHLRVVQGSQARLSGNHRKAERRFAQAEELARVTDNRWVRFEVARERARLLTGAGRTDAGRFEAELAHSLAVEMGWSNRARLMEHEFHMHDRPRLTAGVVSRSVSATEADALKLQRHLDALLEVSLASSMVLRPEQQARVALDEIVRLLGAERAFLFLYSDEAAALELAAGRNADNQDLDDLTGYASTVVEQVWTNLEPIVVSGTDEGAVLGSESAVLHGLRSIMAAPLMIRDRLLGVVYLDSRVARGIFTEDDVQILLALANYIAIALETARAAQLEVQYEVERRERRLAEKLREATTAMTTTLELREVLVRLLESLADVVPHDSAAVMMERDGAFEVVAGRGYPDPEAVRAVRIRLEEDALFQEAARTGQPLVVPDTRREPRFRALGGTEHVLSWMGVPLVSGEGVIGMLTLDSRRTHAYSELEAEMALTFASQAVIGLENARLFGEVQRLAVMDELTGTFNRRHFFTLAEKEVQRAKRYGKPVSLVMLDIDDFKRINDTLGHPVGDEVLRIVARRCKEQVRDVDVMGRYGGEEFAIVLPETSLGGGAKVMAERLRVAVAGTPVETARGELDVAISLGVAELGEGMDLAGLLDRADQALLRAKAKGKNRVEVA